MQDISVFGLTARLTATTTFPNGLTLSQFADDADPLDSPDLEVAQMAMGSNGDVVTWSRPELIEIAMNFIPQDTDDVNLTALVDANRVGPGKSSARDEITIVFTYPNGMKVTCSQGKLVVGNVVQSGSSNGRAKSKRYSFRFAQVSRQGATS